MPSNHHFWNQVNNSHHPHKTIKDVYNNVLLRQTISRIKQFCLVEEYDLIAERVGLNKMVGLALTKVFPGWRVGENTKGAIRLQPLDKNKATSLTDQQIKSGVESAGYKYIASHKPTSNAGAYKITGSKSRSGSFVTHEIEAEGLPVLVIFGAGGNEGNKFEDTVNQEMMEQKGNHPLLKPLLPLIYPDTIASVAPRSGKTKRPYTGKLENVGSIIGDTVITGESGKIYYLSLKNAEGATISNHGCAGVFSSWDNGGVLKFNPEAYPPITDLFQTVGIDFERIFYGLKQYTNAHLGKEYTVVPTEDVPVTQNLEHLRDCIASSIGYGYYYARDKGNGKIHFEDFTSPEKVKSFVGDVQSAVLRYPYVVKPTRPKSRKGVDIISFTNKGWRFIFQFRNAEAGLVPRQLNLMIAGNGMPEPSAEES